MKTAILIEQLKIATAALGDRPKAISSLRCVMQPIGCGQSVTEFKDELSRREYAISGLCQACQDKFFK